MPIESQTCQNEGIRLDSFVTEAFDSTYSRSFYKRLIDDGKVSVNGKVITKAGTKLSETVPPCCHHMRSNPRSSA